MISVSQIRQQLADDRARLKRFKVADLWLFGSAVREGEVIHDLDFLVEFTEPPGLMDYMGLKFFLEETLGVSVDLCTRNSCPKRFFDRIEPELRHVA